MAFNSMVSWFGGHFDCAMRDRESMCGGRKAPALTPFEEPRMMLRRNDAGHVPAATSSPIPAYKAEYGYGGPQSVSEMGPATQKFLATDFSARLSTTSEVATLPPVSPHTIQRMPSPGLDWTSKQNLSIEGAFPALAAESVDEDAVRAHRIHQIQSLCDHQEVAYTAKQSIEEQRGRSIQNGSFPGELPRDFFTRLAAMVAQDRQVQHMVATGDTTLQMTLRSRFLRDCIRERDFSASQSWRSLSVTDKQDFLLAYSCGPASPDFFVNIIRGDRGSLRDAASDCGSLSSMNAFTDLSPSECDFGESRGAAIASY